MLLAHQGGWDEFLLVAAPLVAIAGLLVFANRRVLARLREQAVIDQPTDQADHPHE